MHTTTMTAAKQYRVLLELHITQRELESPGKQNAAQLTICNKALLLLYYNYAMSAYFFILVGP